MNTRRVCIKSWEQLINDGHEVHCSYGVGVPYIRIGDCIVQQHDIFLGQKGTLLCSNDSDVNVVILDNGYRAYCCEEILTYID